MSVGVLLLSALLLGLGCLVAWRGEARAARRRERDRRYAESQTEFIETLQAVVAVEEAYALLTGHLERSLPGSRAVVLARHSSENRLEAAPPDEAEPAIAAALEDAEPRSCMAIRLGRAYARDSAAGDPLIACTLCGTLGTAVCQPLVVAGEAIGSVLVRRDAPLDETDLRRVRESAAQTAPTLLNLRNVALGQRRLTTDTVTGLPNDRTTREMLTRMVAQTNRTLDPLSTIVVDLDHLGQINEASGREKGDQALVAAASVLTEAVRDSDYVGRFGDGGFLVVLPATGPEGAEKAAEKIRGAIAAMGLRGADRAVTASLGIASLPTHGSDDDGLLRIAQRALDVAKARGRNRVELAPVAGKSEGATLFALPGVQLDAAEQD